MFWVLDMRVKNEAPKSSHRLQFGELRCTQGLLEVALGRWTFIHTRQTYRQTQEIMTQPDRQSRCRKS